MTDGFDYLSFDFTADPGDLLAALSAVNSELAITARNRRANIDVDADTAGATAGLAGVSAAADVAARDRTINIDVDVDRSRRRIFDFSRVLGGLTNSFARTRDAATSLGASMTRDLVGAAQTVGRGFSRLFVIMGTLIVLGPQLISLLNVLGGGFFALAASMAPAAGMLATLPGLAMAAGAGMLVLVAGFNGVFDAVKLGEQATQSYVETTTGMESAQRRLARALADVQSAERDLARARRKYSEDLDDARMSASEAIHAEERAIYNLEKANQRLQRAQAGVADVSHKVTQQTDEFTGKIVDVAYATVDAVGGADELREAQLAQQEAEDALRRAQDNRSDSRRYLTEMERKGVEGSEKVVAALGRLEAAHESVTAAQEAEDAARKSSLAQTEQYRQAMEKLSPAGRSFVEFIRNEMLPAWRTMATGIQQRMLPGIESGLRRLVPVFEPVGRELRLIAQDIGAGFDSMSKSLSSDTGVRVLVSMLRSSRKVLSDMGSSIRNVAEGFVWIAMGARGLTETMTGGLAGATQRFADNMRKAFEDGSMQAWFDRVWRVANRVFGLFGNIFGAIYNIGKASNKGLGDSMLKDLLSITQAWQDWTGSAEGQNKIAAWFKNIKAPLYEVTGMLADAVAWMVEFGVSKNFMDTLGAIRDLGKALGDMLTNIGQSQFVPILIDAFTRIATAVGWLVDKVGVLGSVFLLLFRGTLTNILKKFGRYVWMFASALVTAFGWPVVAIGALVAALVAGFVLLWKRSEAFRNFWITIWNGIKATISAVWNGAIKPVFEALKNFITNELIPLFQHWYGNVIKPLLGYIAGEFKALWARVKPPLAAIGRFITNVVAPTIVWLWKNVIAPAFKAIGKVIGFVWNVVIKPLFKAWVWYLSNVLGPAVKWIYEKIIKTYFKLIGAYIGFVWNHTVKPVFSALKYWITEVIGPVFSALWKYAIKPAFERIGEFISNTWKNVIKPAFDAIRGAVAAIRIAFGFLRDRAVAIWEGLGAAMKSVWEDTIKPILDPMLEMIEKIVDGWKKVKGIGGAAAKGIGSLKPWDGALPGLAKGGYMRKGETRLVGERRPEFFTAPTSGRIVPQIGPSVRAAERAQTGGGGLSMEDIERIVERLAQKIRPIEINTTEKVDPRAMASELAWRGR